MKQKFNVRIKNSLANNSVRVKPGGFDLSAGDERELLLLESEVFYFSVDKAIQPQCRVGLRFDYGTDLILKLEKRENENDNSGWALTIEHLENHVGQPVGQHLRQHLPATVKTVDVIIDAVS